MNKKAFTLIELLAVIVILAIIALIATPIILGIINSTREEARKRSAEAVSHAVETAYIQTAMKAETNGSASLNNENVIGNTKIDNERSRTTTSITTNDGVVCTLSSDYVLTCTYGSDTEPLITPKNVSNGTEVSQSSTPRYYYWGSGNISGELPEDADEDLSNIETNGYPFYLAFDSSDGATIDAAYVCFTKGSLAVEYCLQGGDSGTAFESNQGILDTAFPNACSLVGDHYNCSADGLDASAYLGGYVDADGGDAHCKVLENGNFICKEW